MCYGMGTTRPRGSRCAQSAEPSPASARARRGSRETHPLCALSQGVVREWSPATGDHLIAYDDGDFKWHTLAEEEEKGALRLFA